MATLFIERLATRPAWADELNARLRLRRPTSLATVWGPAGTQPLGTLLADEVPSGVDPAFLFLETVRPPLQLLICGAGDDAQALARLSHGLGWSVLVSDPRPAYCTAERFPHASACLVGPPGEVVQTAALDAHSAAVVMSHHYLHDVPFVRALLGSPVTYLGLLGPRKRAVKIAETLAEDTGLPVDDILERLHAPVGLDLGADGPEQVALSILAEIQAGLGKRDGRPLRERKAPIHEA